MEVSHYFSTVNTMLCPLLISTRLKKMHTGVGGENKVWGKWGSVWPNGQMICSIFGRLQHWKFAQKQKSNEQRSKFSKHKIDRQCFAQDFKILTNLVASSWQFKQYQDNYATSPGTNLKLKGYIHWYQYIQNWEVIFGYRFVSDLVETGTT